MPDRSPFDAIGAEAIVAANDRAFAFRDSFPVAPGHTLVVPRRVIASWWDATAEERQALWELVDEVKVQLDVELAPDGYNVGFNAGAAAGQTVFHLHLHVIPRFDGDVADPRGGIRHVLPGGNYLKPRERALWHGPSHPLAPALADVISAVPVARADVVVSFIMQSGLTLLEPLWDRVLDGGGAVRVLVTDYLGITERAALERLGQRAVEYGESFQPRLFRAGNHSFHPKAYLLSTQGGRQCWTFVGSANASWSGLQGGVEWTLQSRERAVHEEASQEFERLWTDPRSTSLLPDVLAAYRQADRATQRVQPAELEPVSLPPAPHSVQQEALTALEQTRLDGFGAGLVVLATGLGKTWLAAFDSTRPQFRRVLFVAHREEILRQARAVFRQVRPEASATLVGGAERRGEADLVFASIQTLARHLETVEPTAYDYVIVDEFHHAAAPTYRRLLGHLQPKFLLGLTATPDRTDGADLLALCEDNLVYACSLAEGIDRALLSPFHYYGVPDSVDFRPLPWRNGRFDPQALEHELVSSERTEAAFREWNERRGSRTMAFCVSQRHADWMAAHFRAQGVAAVAVHTGAESAPREQSLDQLRTGEVEVVFAVDLFNEGVDVPEVDTVLLLRPTSSPVLFLQQVGRGLRLSAGKDALTIVDFVGNHRSFLLPLRTLAGLAGPGSDLRRALTTGDFSLPQGCSVNYSLEATDRLLDLLPVPTRALEDFVSIWYAEHGTRPTALQAFLAGRNPAAAKDGWFSLLARLQVLGPEETGAVAREAKLLLEVQQASMNKSYKMVALRAWLLADPDLTGQTVLRNAAVARTLILRDPRLTADLVTRELPDVRGASETAWTSYWRKWPLEHLVGKGSFRLAGDTFGLTRAAQDPALLSELLHELVDWKLSAYLTRTMLGRLRLRVSHSSGRPIVRFDRVRDAGLPEGVTAVVMDDLMYEADFRKIALNVVREFGGGANVLPDVLRGWFGADVGLPGTAFEVEIFQEAGSWHVEPYRPMAGALRAAE